MPVFGLLMGAALVAGTPANMFMVCSAMKPGADPSLRLWSSYFEVKEPGHDMSAWKDQPGNYGVFQGGGDTGDLLGQWEAYAASQGLKKPSCGISGTLESILKSVATSREAQPLTNQDEQTLARWRPGPKGSVKFLVATYDSGGRRLD